MNINYNKDFWNSRYAVNEYIYGENPNEYLVEKLDSINTGTILFPADGEGRNSIFAAKLGWNVFSFDMSDEGKIKAEKLAKLNSVEINYKVEYAQKVEYEKDFFDAIAFIYSHFPADIKFECNYKLSESLKTGGYIIFEAFSKKQLEYNKQYNSGGPSDINMLYSIEEIKDNFKNFEIIELKETEISLKEGRFHNGLGSVIRFFGRKTG